MSRNTLPTHRVAKSLAIGALTLVAIGSAFPLPALADPPGPAVKKLGNKPPIQVDNGWVIYQSGAKDNPIFFNTDASTGFSASHTIKLKTPGATTDSYFRAAGVAFAPCPNGQNQCQSSEGGTAFGVGLGFGDYLLKAGNKSQGGFVSDDDMSANRTNLVLNPGTIAAVAVGAGGAFAVGQDTAPDTTRQAIVMELDSANQTYDPVSTTFLPPLSGTKSLATNISKNAVYVTGSAPNAVYAHVGDTSWTDLGPQIPKLIDSHKTGKSQALVANDEGDGFIAGTVSVKEDLPALGRTNYSVDVGFVYNITTNTMTFLDVPGADVVPLKVLPDGKVVGNLVFVKPADALSRYSPAVHPFLFDGSNVIDLLATAATGAFQYYFGCQVAIPNNLGEVVGTCIPDQYTPYTAAPADVAFYLNMLAPTPTFVDLNDAIHVNEDNVINGVRAYHFGVATSIDDQGEVTLIGVTYINSKPVQAGFLANKSAYNPGP